jgi:hypothetical protein
MSVSDVQNTVKKSTLNTKRVSLTIPQHTLEKIDRICTLMQISRSAFISHIMDGTMEPMLKVLESVVGNIDLDEGESRRSTINTRVLIQKEINGVQASLSSFSNDIWSEGDTNEH